MVAQYGSDNVSVIGDSAGGGLALAAVQEMVRAGTAPPGHMVLLSPWLDIALSDPAIQLIDDPVASALIPGLKSPGRAGQEALLSPIHGSVRYMGHCKDFLQRPSMQVLGTLRPLMPFDCETKRSPRASTSASCCAPASFTSGRSLLRCPTPSLPFTPYIGSWASFNLARDLLGLAPPRRQRRVGLAT